MKKIKLLNELIQWIFPLASKRLFWLKHSSHLRTLQTLPEFMAYVEKVQPGNFLNYQEQSEKKKTEFNKVINYFFWFWNRNKWNNNHKK